MSDPRAWFEEHRPHLRGVAYRMLGSRGDADDAVQEAWLKLSRADTSNVENARAWLTTVVARICLDMLRARRARREEPVDAAPERAAGGAEEEALLASSVGLALLVVLEALAPAERLAFVLHDLFAVPFEAIAPIVGKSPAAARQLASRARRRVRGAAPSGAPDPDRQRAIVDAFLAASRAGDFDALLALLDPDIVLRGDPEVMPVELRGARAIAARAVETGARAAQAALVDGVPGVVVAPGGRLLMVLRFTVAGGRVTAIEAIGDPARLAALALTVPLQSPA